MEQLIRFLMIVISTSLEVDQIHKKDKERDGIK